MVVAVGTIPDRIRNGFLRKTVHSLLAQHVVPSQILLCGAEVFRKTGESYPWEELKALEALGSEVRACLLKKDYGPFNRLMACLTLGVDEFVMVDDDTMYPPDFLLVMKKLAETYPDSAFSTSGWDIDEAKILSGSKEFEDYTSWRRIAKEHPVLIDVLETGNSFYRSSFFSSEDVKEIQSLTFDRDEHYLDDVFNSSFLARKRIPRRVLFYKPFPLPTAYGMKGRETTKLMKKTSLVGSPRWNDAHRKLLGEKIDVFLADKSSRQRRQRRR